jgi:hypothetical protein
VQWGIPQNTARIDRDPLYVAEIPANRHISTQSVRGRYLYKRSITYRLRSITSNNTARQKCLQIAILAALRAMRSVFCWMLLTPGDHTSNSSRSTDLDHGPSKPP